MSICGLWSADAFPFPTRVRSTSLCGHLSNGGYLVNAVIFSDSLNCIQIKWEWQCKCDLSAIRTPYSARTNIPIPMSVYIWEVLLHSFLGNLNEIFWLACNSHDYSDHWLAELRQFLYPHQYGCIFSTCHSLLFLCHPFVVPVSSTVSSFNFWWGSATKQNLFSDTNQRSQSQPAL